MSDYISRQAAIDTIYELRENFKCWDRYDDVVIRKAYADIPTADVRENVRGEWKDREINKFLSAGYTEHEIYLECSNCGYMTNCASYFCPNCGADMSGGRCG